MLLYTHLFMYFVVHVHRVIILYMYVIFDVVVHVLIYIVVRVLMLLYTMYQRASPGQQKQDTISSSWPGVSPSFVP